MKVRIRFAKTGDLRFIGHLDFMRYVQKTVMRSGIAPIFTAGFNPHMLLSFANPLSLGCESTGEYADLELAYRDPEPLTENEVLRLAEFGLKNEELPESPSGQELLEMLNRTGAKEAQTLGIRRIPAGKSGKAMSIVRYASYEIAPDPSVNPPELLPEQLSGFLAQPEIRVMKKTKSGEKETDIRPLIIDCSLRIREDGFPEEYEGRRGVLQAFLSAGSADNLRADTLAEAFAGYCGIPYDPFRVRILRADLFDGEKRSLGKMGSAL